MCLQDKHQVNVQHLKKQLHDATQTLHFRSHAQLAPVLLHAKLFQ